LQRHLPETPDRREILPITSGFGCHHPQPKDAVKRVSGIACLNYTRRFFLYKLITCVWTYPLIQGKNNKTIRD